MKNSSFDFSETIVKDRIRNISIKRYSNISIYINPVESNYGYYTLVWIDNKYLAQKFLQFADYAALLSFANENNLRISDIPQIASEKPYQNIKHSNNWTPWDVSDNEWESYFVLDRASNAIKIGKSIKGSALGRIENLQTGNPNSLQLLHTTSEYNEDELHEMFKELRITGEWFSANAKLTNFINELINKERV